MKVYLPLLILLSFLLTACGGSSTISGGEQDADLSGTSFEGFFENNSGNDSGNISLSITQHEDNSLTGLAVFDGSDCLVSGRFTGVLVGVNGNIEVTQNMGLVLLSFTATDNSLSGTYTVENTTDGCSNNSGTGRFNASR